jgi:hypothetical protein
MTHLGTRTTSGDDMKESSQGSGMSSPKGAAAAWWQVAAPLSSTGVSSTALRACVLALLVSEGRCRHDEFSRTPECSPCAERHLFAALAGLGVAHLWLALHEAKNGACIAGTPTSGTHHAQTDCKCLARCFATGTRFLQAPAVLSHDAACSDCLNVAVQEHADAKSVLSTPSERLSETEFARRRLEGEELAPSDCVYSGHHHVGCDVRGTIARVQLRSAPPSTHRKPSKLAH